MMPSKSKKQHDFFEAIAHSAEFAKEAGVPQSVGREFADADKGRNYSGPGRSGHSSGRATGKSRSWKGK